MLRLSRISKKAAENCEQTLSKLQAGTTKRIESRDRAIVPGIESRSL
jgi:hypothetical protein